MASSAAVTGAGDADMPFAVEKFEYPDSAKILKEKSIELYKGDGRITLTDCANTHDIQVLSKTGQKDFCFVVKGKQGYLALKLPDAYGIFTEDHPVQAKITVDGQNTIVDAPKNGYTGFGQGDSKSNSAVLLELRVTG
ncbi:hypothetical protein [Streptomyces albireticuli]|uniref:hypothetical protein n=1 Tax=Streptomyces albireticuli TaxID=1940 RepID=UPI0036978905